MNRYCGDRTLNEDLLIRIGGWPAMREAQTLLAAGKVQTATYSHPLLRGRVLLGRRPMLCGLMLRAADDIENLCGCKEARSTGKICAHALAVGLAVIRAKAPTQPPELEQTPPGHTPQPARQAPLADGSARPSGSDSPQVHFHFEGSLRQIDAGITFHYPCPGGCNTGAELDVVRELEQAGFVRRADQFVLTGERNILDFFAAKLPVWEKRWAVEAGPRFRHVTRNLVRLDPRFDLRAGQTDGWLDFRVHYSAGSEAVLPARELHRLLSGGQTTLQLRSGKTAVVNRGLLEDLDEVLRDCDPQAAGSGWKVPAVCGGYLERTVAHWSGAAPQQLPVAEIAAGSLAAVLRPYQSAGVRWMAGLAGRGLGGILADEMGLGKTVQALAAIERIGGVALVVCPSSLVWNWQAEAARFLPELRVVAIDGPRREAAFARIAEADLVVTSYALLRRDLSRYSKFEFATVVLDEAQHIKNPDSQNARAARGLRARSRFILTGTPVENSLRDLWSLFQFLLPGYLGSREDFRERYATPLLESADGSVFDRLARRIGPFLLRRTKAEILPELPPKIEQILEIDLTAAQKKVYDQLQEAARNELDALAGRSEGAARMQVLTALLRLRQVCCDPRLLTSGGELDDQDSAKLVALIELIEEAMDGGHRALVFSQFTSMLDLAGAALTRRNIAFCRLDGATKDRAGAVRKFQTDESIPVFLISLKAGGTGLNLVGADTVIHYDPWWNPAVEAQATDRAHRIGQTRVVNSIKLVARDSIEQRIIRLQEQKSRMFASALDADRAWAGLDFDDIAGLLDTTPE